MTWEDAALMFLRDKRRDNVSPATLTNYAYVLQGDMTQAWLRDQRIVTLADVDSDALGALQDALRAGVSNRGRPFKDATLHSFHRVTRTFLGWAVERGLDVGTRALNRRAPILPETAPDFLTEAEVGRIMRTVRNPRDKFIVEFLLRTGLRASEMCALYVDDITTGPRGNWVIVRQGKGRKDRTVPLDSKTVKFSRDVETYKRKVRPASQDDHLFLSLRRTDDDYAPLSVEGLKSMVERLGREARVHLHPHRFRHTFGTRALADGVDVVTLQRMMGHANIATTLRYLHTDAESLARSYGHSGRA